MSKKKLYDLRYALMDELMPAAYVNNATNEEIFEWARNLVPRASPITTVSWDLETLMPKTFAATRATCASPQASDTSAAEQDEFDF